MAAFQHRYQRPADCPAVIIPGGATELKFNRVEDMYTIGYSSGWYGRFSLKDSKYILTRGVKIEGDYVIFYRCSEIDKWEHLIIRFKNDKINLLIYDNHNDEEIIIDYTSKEIYHYKGNYLVLGMKDNTIEMGKIVIADNAHVNTFNFNIDLELFKTCPKYTTDATHTPYNSGLSSGWGDRGKDFTTSCSSK